MRFAVTILFGVLIGAVAGCANGEPTPAAEIALQTLPAATSTARPTVTPTLSLIPVEPTIIGPQRLSIWLPEPLAPVDNTAASAQRDGWISGFEAVEDDLTVTIRLKRAADVGGVLQTLRSASLVAPGALPDLALLRRSDLLSAVSLSLIQPLDPVALASITQDLHPALIAMGSVEDRLFALPFTVDVAHLAINRESIPIGSDTPAWTFDSVLARRASILFPAGRASIVNETFLAQYRAAAGVNTGSNGSAAGLPIDRAALESVLGFYEAARDLGIIPTSVLEYTTSTDYAAQILAGEVDAGVMSSSAYLSLLSNGVDLAYATIPTPDGSASTVIDGWMWVITTADAGRQAAALRFLNWLFDIDRHASYTRTINMLPTGRTTLHQIDDDAYALFADDLLAHASLPLTDASGGVAGRAMQGALAAVLRGESTAADAVQDVIDQVG